MSGGAGGVGGSGSGQNPLYSYGFGNPQQTQNNSPYGQQPSGNYQGAQGAFPAGGVWAGNPQPQSLPTYRRGPQPHPSGTPPPWLTGPQRNAAIEARDMIPGVRADLSTARQEAEHQRAAIEPL